MTIKRDPSGRRSIQVEVEVPGTPEEVWEAIATGPGISSWFYPDRRRGAASAASSHTTPVPRWTSRPPSPSGTRRTGSAMKGRIADRTVHQRPPSGPSSRGPAAAAWCGWCTACSRAPTTGTISSRISRPDGPSASPSCGPISPTSAGNARPSSARWEPADGSAHDAWNAVLAALEAGGLSPGGRWASAVSGADFAGVVEESRSGRQPCTVFRLDQPAPGIAVASTYKIGARATVTLNIYFYGDDAPAAADRYEAGLQAWMAARFP